MTVCINFFGGPGSGKSTTASELYSFLKKKNYSVELVQEFAKDLVYENSETLLGIQLVVFAEQFKRQWRLLNKVDYIVTDSPLLLSSVYFELYFDRTEQKHFTPQYKQLSINFFDSTFKQFSNINYFLQRDVTFDRSGRVNDESESKLIDNLILKKLKNSNILVDKINTTTAIDQIIKHRFV